MEAVPLRHCCESCALLKPAVKTAWGLQNPLQAPEGHRGEMPRAPGWKWGKGSLRLAHHLIFTRRVKRMRSGANQAAGTDTKPETALFALRSAFHQGCWDYGDLRFHLSINFSKPHYIFSAPPRPRPPASFTEIQLYIILFLGRSSG